MWSIRFFWAVLKLLRFVFRAMGFLRLRYDRAKQRFDVDPPNWFKENISFIVILLVISLHFYLLIEMADFYREMTETQPDLSPPFDLFLLIYEMIQDVGIVLLLFYYLRERHQLWRLIDLAQSCYNQLIGLPKKRFAFSCSKLMILMAIGQLLLLVLLCLKLSCWDWPHLNKFAILDYLMGAVRLVFYLVLTLQFFYHLLHAALLQSLQLMLQQHRNLKLLHQVLNVQPALQRLQHFAACYFGILFGFFFTLLYLRCSVFIRLFGYVERRLTVDAENPDGEMLRPPTREQLLRGESLQLTWLMTFMGLLLSAALWQQREQNKLIQGIWKIDFPSAAEASGLSKNARVAKDMQSFLLNSRLAIVDFRSGSMNFLSWQLNSSHSRVPLVAVAKAFKLLLQVLLFSSLVYLGWEGRVATGWEL